MHAMISNVSEAYANTVSLGERYTVFIRDGDAPKGGTGISIAIDSKEGAEEIAAVINKWCRPDSLAGTCEKLLAEEERRRKAEPYAIDERFMEKVE